MNNRTALVFGGTGLVGGYLLEELVRLETYQKIIVVSRRETDIKNDKISFVINRLEDPDEISDLIRGNDLFCCLGTTIKKAGSREAFKKVDLFLPMKIAEIASGNHVNNFAVISSIGADAGSKNFYLQVKGMMEQEVMKHPFEHTVIVRPSLLLGDRKEFRLSEKAAGMFMPLINPLLRGNWRRFRSIHGRAVAKAMINLVLFPRKKTIFESDELSDVSNNDL